MNRWELTAHDKDTDELLHADEGRMIGDEIYKLMEYKDNRTGRDPAAPQMPLSEVEMDLTLTLPIDNKWVKLRAAVRLYCRQDEQTIDQAAEIGLKKVNEFVSVGADIVAKAIAARSQ